MQAGALLQFNHPVRRWVEFCDGLGSFLVRFGVDSSSKWVACFLVVRGFAAILASYGRRWIDTVAALLSRFFNEFARRRHYPCVVGTLSCFTVVSF